MYLGEWLSQAAIERSSDAAECRHGVEPQPASQLARPMTQINGRRADVVSKTQQVALKVGGNHGQPRGVLDSQFANGQGPRRTA